MQLSLHLVAVDGHHQRACERLGLLGEREPRRHGAQRPVERDEGAAQERERGRDREVVALEDLDHRLEHADVEAGPAAHVHDHEPTEVGFQRGEVRARRRRGDREHRPLEELGVVERGREQQTAECLER